MMTEEEKDKALKAFALDCASKGIDIEKDLLPCIEFFNFYWGCIKRLADKNEAALKKYFNQK